MATTDDEYTDRERRAYALRHSLRNGPAAVGKLLARIGGISWGETEVITDDLHDWLTDDLGLDCNLDQAQQTVADALLIDRWAGHIKQYVLRGECGYPVYRKVCRQPLGHDRPLSRSDRTDCVYVAPAPWDRQP